MWAACSLAVVERLRLRRLHWGNPEQTAALVDAFGRFDVILGADVVYDEEFVPQLFGSIAGLLKPGPEVILTPLDPLQSAYCLHAAQGSSGRMCVGRV